MPPFTVARRCGSAHKRDSTWRNYQRGCDQVVGFAASILCVAQRTDSVSPLCYERGSPTPGDRMAPDQQQRFFVLVAEDVEETRDGIERLLTTDGYSVSTAKTEKEAVLKARLQPPDLILMSLGIDAEEIADMGRRIREAAGLGGSVPIVIFCVGRLEEGTEAGVGYNTYMTRPDNFDQLRRLLIRLLRTEPRAY